MQTDQVLGSAIRVTAGIGNKPAAGFWKFWVVGNEVYATNRSGGHVVKISIHESGQIHMHMGKEKPQLLARPLILGNGDWLHGLEVRFLLSPDALLPPSENLKGKKAYVINVPADHYALLNVLITSHAGVNYTALPAEFQTPVRVMWRASLRSGRVVLLLARVAQLDEANRQAISQMREELKPRANFAAKPDSPPYVEIRNVLWSAAGGNVALVIPMGQEGYSFPGKT